MPKVRYRMDHHGENYAMRDDEVGCSRAESFAAGDNSTAVVSQELGDDSLAGPWRSFSHQPVPAHYYVTTSAV